METKKLTSVNYKAIFRLHSWWHDPGKRRLFVIVQRWHDDSGDIEAVELLEEKQERSKKMSIESMINYFNKGLLVTVSNMPI